MLSCHCHGGSFIGSAEYVYFACCYLYYIRPIHTADADDATHLLSWVASAVCTYGIYNWLATVSTNLNKFADSEVELPLVCRRCERTRQQSWWPSLQNFLCSWAIEVGDKWRHNDVIVEKVINIDQNSRRQTAMDYELYEVCLVSFQIVDRIRRQSSWASCKFCSHRRSDATQLVSWVASASAVCTGQ